uniref:AP2/ERF domain-containing protein n=1 Tax=Setaria viridis TaxID=4556 RepID=A0A4U6UWM9_SETVI|nr:hypothetical protein SEVIR_4G037500v2 [Setaria viridis]
MQPSAAAAAPAGERKYKGVRRRKWVRWASEIRLPNSRDRIWLGSYDAPEKAARAFDAAYLCLRGSGGADGLNFPGSPPGVRRTSDPNEVYAAAVSHADPAAADVDPWDAAQPPPEPTLQAHGDVAPMEPAPAPAAPPAPLQLLADLPPLFSPTEVGSHAYLLPASPTAADANTMEENGSGSGSGSGLWSF